MLDIHAPLLTAFPDLLQVLTLLAMERPISFSAEDIRDEKVRLASTLFPSIESNLLSTIGDGKVFDGSASFMFLVAEGEESTWIAFPLFAETEVAASEMEREEARVPKLLGKAEDHPDRTECICCKAERESVWIRSQHLSKACSKGEC